MGCICQEMAGPGAELAPVCVGQLWVSDNLAPAELEVLATSAKRQQSEIGTFIFNHGDPSDEELSFLIGTHRVSITRAMKYLKKTGKIITDSRYLIVAQ